MEELVFQRRFRSSKRVMRQLIFGQGCQEKCVLHQKQINKFSVVLNQILCLQLFAHFNLLCEVAMQLLQIHPSFFTSYPLQPHLAQQLLIFLKKVLELLPSQSSIYNGAPVLLLNFYLYTYGVVQIKIKECFLSPIYRATFTFTYFPQKRTLPKLLLLNYPYNILPINKVKTIQTEFLLAIGRIHVSEASVDHFFFELAHMAKPNFKERMIFRLFLMMKNLNNFGFLILLIVIDMVFFPLLRQIVIHQYYKFRNRLFYGGSIPTIYNQTNSASLTTIHTSPLLFLCSYYEYGFLCQHSSSSNCTVILQCRFYDHSVPSEHTSY